MNHTRVIGYIPTIDKFLVYYGNYTFVAACVNDYYGGVSLSYDSYYTRGGGYPLIDHVWVHYVVIRRRADETYLSV